MGDAGIPTHAAGLWTGTFYSPDGTVESCSASLAFLAQADTYPSVFGATLDAQDCVAIVHGTWRGELSEFTMREFAHNGTRELTGSMTRSEAGDLLLRGTWCKEIHNGSAGGFVFLLEKEDPEIQISGLWVGKSDVDLALADFCIPANPMYPIEKPFVFFFV